jgi:hypothetical protein
MKISPPPLNSSLFSIKILITLFSYTFSPCFSLFVRNRSLRRSVLEGQDELDMQIVFKKRKVEV